MLIHLFINNNEHLPGLSHRGNNLIKLELSKCCEIMYIYFYIFITILRPVVVVGMFRRSSFSLREPASLDREIAESRSESPTEISMSVTMLHTHVCTYARTHIRCGHNSYTATISL